MKKFGVFALSEAEDVEAFVAAVEKMTARTKTERSAEIVDQNVVASDARRCWKCVIAIPTVDLLDRVVKIGTCSGADTDKFAKFKLTAVPAKVVKAPLIKECLANIECKVIDVVSKHNLVVLEAVAAHIDSTRKEQRMVHAVGDGTFIVDGRRFDRKKMMVSKIPAGL